ncbi:PREDICTED: transmembrane protein 170A isoform X2 [Nanorana parkeri]|uniref:transmembrane protein 170A isoform X2 n=1 Tax=Nanorana parkeri TaxID=125878 RepID=UPI000854BA87|nr:PREDICTED: transmembrane protein 170A isoform X2 [Nanorana parkeri]
MDSGEPGGETGLLQQILSLSLVPRVGNVSVCPSNTTLCFFPEMWYGVFLWALVSSLFFHIPAGLLALFTLRHHKTGAAIAGVYKAAAKEMIPFEALVLGVGQTFCVLIVSFLRILATL